MEHVQNKPFELHLFRHNTSATPWVSRSRDACIIIGDRGSFATTNPMDVLITRMSQLQQVLLKQKTEAIDLEKGTSELQKLPEYNHESVAVDLQDWLYLVGQQVGGMASTADAWWRAVLSAAQKAYQVHQSLPPIQRLSVRVDLGADWMDTKFQKLERRVTALLASRGRVLQRERGAYCVDPRNIG